MADRETTVTNAYQSTLTAELSAVAGTAELADASGLVAPFYLVIEPDDAGQREYVYVSELVGSTATLAERYLAGSAAPSGLVHPSGAVVRHAFVAQHLVDINDRVDAFSDHSGGTDTDDHPEATPSVRGFMSAADKTKLDGVDAGAQADHAGLSGVTADQHHAQDHAARHAPGGADALAATMVRASKNPPSNVGLTDLQADIITDTITIPAGWGSYDLEVVAYVLAKLTQNETDPALIWARIDPVGTWFRQYITDDPPLLDGGFPVAWPVTFPVSAVLEGETVTGDRQVKLQAFQTLDGNPSVSIGTETLMVIKAYRTS